ncbi:MAG: extracellular solute-binding protein [Ruminococcaceae bacterium]|nr:extracellular solute-binding protein [Oscillospiraceae bacterium]
MKSLHKRLSRRITAAMLLAALVLPITSCSEEPAAPDTPDTTAPAVESTTAPVETTQEITRENHPDNLPELNLGGRTVNINVNSDALYNIDWVAEQTGDLVQDAVYNRNLAVEERLKVKLNTQMTHGAGTAKAKPLLTAILAGDSEIQIINIAAQDTTKFMQSGILHNLPDLKYLDFDMPWWNQDVMDICTYNGKAFFATGEIAFRYLDGMSVFLFNTKMAEDNNIGDLYQLFFDGKWTYDKMFEYSEAVKKDLNGDGTMTLDDVWGLATNGYANMDPWYASWDQPITKMDKDGFPELCVNNEKMVSMVEKLYKLYWENPGVSTQAGTYTNMTYRPIFIDGRALFDADTLYALKLLREVPFEFGVLTYPKFDENQENYYTHNRNGYSLYSIASPAKNPDEAAAVLEAAAAESYRSVTKVYLEEGLKLKYSRDSESGKVIDIMLENTKTDFAFFTDIMYILRNVLKNSKDQSPNFASFYAANVNTYQAILDQMKAEFVKTAG